MNAEILWKPWGDFDENYHNTKVVVVHCHDCLQTNRNKYLMKNTKIFRIHNMKGIGMMIRHVPDERSRHEGDRLEPQGWMHDHKSLEILAQSAKQ